MSKDNTPREDATKQKLVQQVVGSIIYYVKGVDSIGLTGLLTLSSKQAQTTGHIVTNMEQIIGYLTTNPDATI